MTGPGLNRRTILAGAAVLPLLTSGILRAAAPDLAALRDLTTGTRPISRDERTRRLARAPGRSCSSSCDQDMGCSPPVSRAVIRS